MKKVHEKMLLAVALIAAALVGLGSAVFLLREFQQRDREMRGQPMETAGRAEEREGMPWKT